MKQITALFLLLIFPIISQGQNVGSVYPTGATNQASVQKGAMGWDSVGVMGVMDTTRAKAYLSSGTATLRQKGRFFLDKNDSTKVWYHDGAKLRQMNVDESQNKIIGTLYNANEWADLSDFDTNFNGVTIDGNGKINITGGSVDTPTVLSWKYTTCLTSWQMATRFEVGQKSATSHGVAIGIWGTGRQTVGSDWSTFAYLNTTTHATQGGKLYILTGLNPSGSVAVDSSTNKLTVSVGDIVVLRTKWEYTTMYVYATNITTGASIMTTLNFGASVIRYNTGQYSLWSKGGAVIVDSLNVCSEAVKNIDVLFRGDSKSSCIGVTDISKCHTRIVQKHYPNSSIQAGIGDHIGDAINTLPETRKQSPKQVLVNLYYNDLWAFPADTVCELYARYIDSLNAIPTVSYKMTPQDYPSIAYPEIRARYDSFRTWLYATYDSSEIIDAFADVQSCGTACNAAGAHPTDSGQNLIAQVVINSGKLAGATEVHELIERLISENMPSTTTPGLTEVLTENPITTLPLTTGKWTAAVVADNTSPDVIDIRNNGAGASTGTSIRYGFGQKIVGQFLPNGSTFYDKNGTDNFYVSSSEATYSKSVTIKTTLANGRLTLNAENGASADVYIKSANGLTINTFSGGSFADRFRVSADGAVTTAQPTASGAGAFKIGKILTGSDTNKYLEIEIDGVDYYIRALTTLP